MKRRGRTALARTGPGASPSAPSRLECPSLQGPGLKHLVHQVDKAQGVLSDMQPGPETGFLTQPSSFLLGKRRRRNTARGAPQPGCPPFRGEPAPSL